MQQMSLRITPGIARTPTCGKSRPRAAGKPYEKAHRTKLLATFVPKFTHLVPKELVPLIVEFSFHVGFY